MGYRCPDTLADPAGAGSDRYKALLALRPFAFGVHRARWGGDKIEIAKILHAGSWPRFSSGERELSQLEQHQQQPKRQLHSAALNREVEMSQGESRGDREELHSGLEFVSSDDRLFKVLPVPEAYGNEPSWSWEQEN